MELELCRGQAEMWKRVEVKVHETALISGPFPLARTTVSPKLYVSV